ncbi:MAG: hypothetical protein WDA09_08635 [Bacteriovoracaceae bacterium]
MKNPILVIGIILFGLFIHQVATKEKWGIFHNDRYTPTSCRAAVVKIDKSIPANWKTECEGNNLAVFIKENTSVDDQNLQPLLYRQLANHMSYIAKIATIDVLEKVDWVRFKIIHEKMIINAVTEGKYIVKLATLEDPELIRSHLQSTVQVQEVRE